MLLLGWVSVAHGPGRSEEVTVPGRSQIDLGLGRVEGNGAMISVTPRPALKNIVRVQKNPSPPGSAGRHPDLSATQTQGTVTKQIIEKENEILQIHRAAEALANPHLERIGARRLGQRLQPGAIELDPRQLNRPIRQAPTGEAQGRGQVFRIHRRRDHVEAPIRAQHPRRLARCWLPKGRGSSRRQESESERHRHHHHHRHSDSHTPSALRRGAPSPALAQFSPRRTQHEPFSQTSHGPARSGSPAPDDAG